MTRERPVRICEGGGVRFLSATRLVVGFEHEADARRVRDAMRARLGEFGLTLEPNKTKLIEFGRYAEDDAGNVGSETGDVLLSGVDAHLQAKPEGQPSSSGGVVSTACGRTSGGQGKS